MFIDLIKGKKDKEKVEISDERLDELMDQLFSKAGEEDEDEDFDEMDEDMDKGAGYYSKQKQKTEKARALLKAEEDEEEDLDDTEDEDEDEDELEKGLDKKERREMMSKVYSMVDDLSDSELEAFLSSREVKKALAMNIFNQMSTSELRDFMSTDEANGFDKMQDVKKAEEDDFDEDFDEMDKGEGMEARLREMDKGLEMLGFKE